MDRTTIPADLRELYLQDFGPIPFAEYLALEFDCDGKLANSDSNRELVALIFERRGRRWVSRSITYDGGYSGVLLL